MMRVYLAYDDIPKVTELLYDERGNREELGQNHGSCSRYQLAIGGQEAVDRHDSWCLYFVLWGLLQLLGDRAALRQVVPAITGSCEDFRQAARKSGLLMPVGTTPHPGDIGLVVNTATNHAHHAFWIAHSPMNVGEGWATEEGNSNNSGGSNGDGAYVRDKRWGPGDSAATGHGTNHYELVRLTDPAIPFPDWL